MIGVAQLASRYRVADEPLRTERRIELILVVVCLLVILQLVWWAVSRLGSPSVASVEPASDSLRVTAVESTGSISGAQSMALQARPLFWSSRRPIGPVVVVEDEGAAGEAGRPAKRLEDFALTGLFGAGREGGAIVTYKGERSRLRVGDDLDGWTLNSVNGGAAIFVSAGSRDVRRLLPLPVIAMEPGTDAVDRRSSSDAALPSVEADARLRMAPAQSPTDQAQQKKAKLSLGG